MTENNLVTENRDVDTDTIIIGIKNEESRDGIDKTNLGLKVKRLRVPRIRKIGSLFTPLRS